VGDKMTFKIITLGCKVNTYESEYMLEELLKSGYIYNEEKPDIVIINTCSVTNMADSKSLKIVRRVKRENPNSILVVCGCSVQNNSEKYIDLEIDILIGNREKSKIVNLIENYYKTKEKYQYLTKERNLDFEDMKVSKFTTHTRAFIKIQDGCNNFCSYCIIPYTRGSIRSKDFNKTIEEVKELVENGHKEIVLTGINTGSYNDNGRDLSDLLIELAKIKDLERIRISSIEITELDSKFLNTLKNTPKICNHLHIPLQSGSENILKRMNRKYDKEYFYKKIEEIRNIREYISITTDCIVGHPYETEDDFNEYLEFCQKVNFSKIHVFPYSIRVGTASSTMPQVNDNIKKERAKKLIALSNELEKEYNKKFIGETLEIITEEEVGDYIIGHTSNYLKVYIKGDYKLNSTYKVKIERLENNILYGQVSCCSNSKISI
jgi:threonylcarbamoyladenosine tRNA methylthiotransferase MtaB